MPKLNGNGKVHDVLGDADIDASLVATTGPYPITRSNAPWPSIPQR
jgi:hypothetical protein